MMTLPPCNCTICYQMYNNERSPLILTKCGHTFCRECLDIIMNQTLKQISCPECKQITEISENPAKNLPKNRGLLNLIIYNESVSKSSARKDDPSPSKKSSPESEKVVIEYEAAIGKIEETYNKIIEEHSYLKDISEVLLKKEVDDSMDHLISIINDYRTLLYKKIESEFEKINLIKSFKGSIEKYRGKLTEITNKATGNSGNKNLNCSIIEEGRSILTASMVTAPEEEIIQSESSSGGPLSDKEISDIKGEIKFIELYNLTLNNYRKDIYDPCKFFFVNKFQCEKLNEDLRRLLIKVCDFDESIFANGINKINNYDEKKILRELQEACSQSNLKKLQCIFSHFKINPNFFFSDHQDYLTNTTTVLDLTNPSQGNIGSQTFTSSFNSQLHLSVPGNQRNTGGNNILRNLTGNTGRANQNQPGNVQNSSGTSGVKEKVVNLNTYLKQFKDKGELVKVTKFLIDELGYIPLKLDCETRVEVNLVRDVEWKVPLSII